MEEKVFTPRGKEERDLFLGRMSPLHNGHLAIMKMMKKNPVVVLVKGKNSSEDKKKNPFDEKYQTELIHKVMPHMEVSVAPNGFLPGILGFFRKKGQEITRIFAGSDRIESYKSAIDAANKKMSPEYHYNVEFIETPRVTSATTVREALKNNDQKTFDKNMPKELHGEFEKMRKIYTALLESFEFTSFRKFLFESEDSSVTTTSGSIDMYDEPWNDYERDNGMMEMLGIPRDSKLKKFEFATEKEMEQRDIKRMKTQFFA